MMTTDQPRKTDGRSSISINETQMPTIATFLCFTPGAPQQLAIKVKTARHQLDSSAIRTACGGYANGPSHAITASPIALTMATSNAMAPIRGAAARLR
jgi:hypothetical protein